MRRRPSSWARPGPRTDHRVLPRHTRAGRGRHGLRLPGRAHADRAQGGHQGPEPRLAADQDVVSRFFTEARAVNDIRHPNIVDVTDFGQLDGRPTSSWSTSRARRLARPPASARRAARRAPRVRSCSSAPSALGAAHEQGHRPPRPQAREHLPAPPPRATRDFVKVLDFGIAKLLRAEPSGEHQDPDRRVMGTPRYMSPEQCLGERARHPQRRLQPGRRPLPDADRALPFTGDTLGRLIVCHVNEAAGPTQRDQPRHLARDERRDPAGPAEEAQGSLSERARHARCAGARAAAHLARARRLPSASRSSRLPTCPRAEGLVSRPPAGRAVIPAGSAQPGRRSCFGWDQLG